MCFQSHQQAKLCKPEQCSRQMNESEESASELFEAHSDSAMIFDLHEKAFNKMPFFVVTEIGVSSCHLCAPRDYHFVITLYTICAIFARCYSIPFNRLSLETHSNSTCQPKILNSAVALPGKTEAFALAPIPNPPL